jgi:hypothetical protein
VAVLARFLRRPPSPMLGPARRDLVRWNGR